MWYLKVVSVYFDCLRVHSFDCFCESGRQASAAGALTTGGAEPRIISIECPLRHVSTSMTVAYDCSRMDAPWDHGASGSIPGRWVPSSNNSACIQSTPSPSRNHPHPNMPFTSIYSCHLPARPRPPPTGHSHRSHRPPGSIHGRFAANAERCASST